MVIFSPRNRPTFIVLIFLFLSFLFFLYNLRQPQKSFFLEQAVFSFLSQIQKATNSFFSLPLNIWKNYIFLVNTKKQNQLLKKEIKRLQKEVLSLREMALANTRLRKLLGFKKGSPLNLVTAQVVGVDASLYFKSIIIDKGLRHGIKKDLAVISPDGVVGRILKAMDSFSVVLLLFDQNFALDAMVQRTRSRGIVEGTGDSLCKLKYVLDSENIRCGDVVLTSGMEGVFPKGIMIGEIVSVNRDEGSLFQNITIRPNCDFRKLEEVFVVLGRKK